MIAYTPDIEVSKERQQQIAHDAKIRSAALEEAASLSEHIHGGGICGTARNPIKYNDDGASIAAAIRALKGADHAE